MSTFEEAIDLWFYQTIDGSAIPAEVLNCLEANAVRIFSKCRYKSDCGTATSLWFKAFKKCGIKAAIISGQYVPPFHHMYNDIVSGKIEPPMMSDHVWLEVDDNIIFDPTAGQFGNKIDLKAYLDESGKPLYTQQNNVVPIYKNYEALVDEVMSHLDWTPMRKINGKEYYAATIIHLLKLGYTPSMVAVKIDEIEYDAIMKDDEDVIYESAKQQRLLEATGKINFDETEIAYWNDMQQHRQDIVPIVENFGKQCVIKVMQKLAKEGTLTSDDIKKIYPTKAELAEMFDKVLDLPESPTNYRDVYKKAWVNAIKRAGGLSLLYGFTYKEHTFKCVNIENIDSRSDLYIFELTGDNSDLKRFMQFLLYRCYCFLFRFYFNIYAGSSYFNAFTGQYHNTTYIRKSFNFVDNYFSRKFLEFR